MYRRLLIPFLLSGSLDGGEMCCNDSDGSKARTSDSPSIDYNNYRTISPEYGRDKNASQGCGTLGSRCDRTSFVESHARSHQSKLTYNIVHIYEYKNLSFVLTYNVNYYVSEQAYDDNESAVRKSAVFCMVAIHLAVGEELLKPHLSCLYTSKLKLLNIYIQRAQQANSQPASPRSNSKN